MGRFTVLARHRILGTKVDVFVLPMSAIASSSFRRTLMATLEAGDGGGVDEAAAERVQAEMVAACTFDDEEGTRSTFATWEAVRDELTHTQLEALALAILDASGYTAAAREAARRFPDGDGEAGGVADPSGGEGVRAEAE
jgi:hypothetical protein